MPQTDPTRNNGTSVVADPKYSAVIGWDGLGLPGSSYAGVGGFGSPSPYTNAIISLAGFDDGLPAWGLSPRLRDNMIRSFWPTEGLMASSIFTTVAKYASFEWGLEGPARTTAIYQRILNSVEHGKGWSHFISKVLVDVFTQDNGAFVEIVRISDSPTSPCISMNHLDSGSCQRTGKRDYPVVYWDVNSIPHIMPWYTVLDFTEFPSPVERSFGAQYCAVTRMLRAAQIMKSLSIYKDEKLSGRFERAVHLVSGVQRKSIDDAIVQAKNIRLGDQTQRYIQPVIIAALDPTAHVSSVTLELAGLPDGFNEEEWTKWYIAQVALAFGGDYQDYAPTMGQGMNSGGAGARVMHQKAKGKGARRFMTMIEQALNFQGVLPDTVHFTYDDQDIDDQLSRANLRKERALERQVRILSGEIAPEIARQMAVRSGDLTVDELAMMGEEVGADSVVAGGYENMETQPSPGVKKIVDGPSEPPNTKGEMAPGVSNSATSTPGMGKPQSPTRGQPNSNVTTKKAPAQSQKQ